MYFILLRNATIKGGEIICSELCLLSTSVPLLFIAVFLQFLIRRIELDTRMMITCLSTIVKCFMIDTRTKAMKKAFYSSNDC